MAVRLFFCTAPLIAADQIAATLVEERLCACVNVVRTVQSVYRWNGALTRDDEALLILKSTADAAGALRARLLEVHPYELPEILALGVDEGASLPEYLRWVETEVR